MEKYYSSPAFVGAYKSRELQEKTDKMAGIVEGLEKLLKLTKIDT